MTRLTAASEDLGPVEALAEEFLARRRAGERPTVEEYADRHPALADRIRAFFPALGLVDRKSTRLNSSHTVSSYAVVSLTNNSAGLSLPPCAITACGSGGA